MTIQTINPATGKAIQTYEIFSEKTIQGILEKTHEAYQQWRTTTFSERKEKLLNLAEVIKNRKEEIATLITSEMGKPIQDARGEIDKCVWAATYYAENAENLLKDRVIDTGDEKKTKVCYRPLGIVFAIMPWNFPLWQVFRFLCPTMMAGNAALLSHANISTGLSLLIDEMTTEAGYPEHLFRSLIITNEQAASVIAHRYVSGVTLTGSGRAGSAVASVAGKHLKKVVLELGGSDPYLILEDADIDKAAATCVASRMKVTGQVCIAAKRLIVVESVREAFEQKVMEKIQAYKMGDPLSDETNFGPMAREDLRETLHEQVQTTMAEGAELLLGGEIPEGPGFYYPPTVLRNVTSDMLPFREELFGPVVVIIPAKDEAHAIKLANQTAYGLAAGVFTEDVEKGERIATELIEAGSVAVNSFVSSDPRVPFGGIKSSGFGRELSAEGIHEFVNIKSILVS